MHLGFPRSTVWLAALAVSVPLLTGCVAAVVGGAAAGVLVATDRRSIGTQLADQNIELVAAGNVQKAIGSRGHVDIVSYYRKVLLVGEVPTEEDKAKVVAAVTATPDIASVVNDLVVMPNEPLEQRSDDTVITARVKTNLLNANGVPANSIKVITARGNTYLMGRLTQREADLATEVARTTVGVKRVVRVVDIISAQEALHPANDGKNEKPVPVTTVPSAGSQVQPAEPAGAVAYPVSQPVVQEQQPAQVQQLPPRN